MPTQWWVVSVCKKNNAFTSNKIKPKSTTSQQAEKVYNRNLYCLRTKLQGTGFTGPAKPIKPKDPGCFASGTLPTQAFRQNGLLV